MKRTITGRTQSRTMTLGDLRQFLASLESLPDEAAVKARVSWGKRLREVTVEEDDIGFRDYIRAVEGTKPDGEESSSPPSTPASA
jgi:hypothetical protein